MREIKQIKHSVYIRTDFYGNVLEIYSSAFNNSRIDGILIAEGYGDKYRHAQTCFLEKPLINENGDYNYQFDGVKIVDRGV